MAMQAAIVRKLQPSKPAALLPASAKLQFLGDVAGFCRGQDRLQVLRRPQSAVVRELRHFPAACT